MSSLKSKTRRIKFWFNLFKAYFNRYRFRIMIFISVVLIASWLITLAWPKIIRSNIVTIGYVGAYTIEDVPAEILSLATDSLIILDTSGKPQPSLASHWTVAEDGKSYVVFLKDNLTWHDGTQVDAKDIQIAIDNVNVTALNNKAIEFKLPNPISSFPSALNKPVFKTGSFYGTGSYRIVGLDRTEGIIQKISLAPKSENLPQVDLKFYPTENQLLEAIKMGDVKLASVANAGIFQQWQNLSVEKTVDESEIITIFYNTQDPLLSSKELRQGLNYAIDRSEFDGEPAHSPNSPSSWVYNENVKRYDYNLGKSKELISKSESPELKITLSTIGDFSEVAHSVARDWEEAGVKVEIVEEKSVPENFQVLLAVNKITLNTDQYGLWHSTQKQTNLTNFNDPKIDKLLEDARTEEGEEARRDLYLDFQRFIVEEAPAAFLYHPYRYKVVYKNIETLTSKLPDIF